MPLPYRHLTSVLLRREGELFLFDAGEATQISIRRLNLRWKNITAIFISHMHADHVTGLPGILMLSSQVDRDKPLYIYGPPKLAEFVDQTRKSLDMFINYERGMNCLRFAPEVGSADCANYIIRPEVYARHPFTEFIPDRIGTADGLVVESCVADGATWVRVPKFLVMHGSERP